MIWWFLAGVIGVPCLVALVVLTIRAMAVRGYEDENGFHYGTPHEEDE